MARTTIKTGNIRNLNVTSGKLEEDITVAGDLIVTGNLTVDGTTTTVNTEQLIIEDNLITLNGGYIGDPNGATPPPNSGIEIERGTGLNASIVWNESNDRWDLSHPIHVKVNEDVAILDIEQSSDIVDIWKIREQDAQTHGFYLRYKGDESGDNNALELWGNNQGSDDRRVYRVQQSGAIAFDQVATFNNNVSLASGKTVDGVDISSHNANGIANVKHVTDAYLAALAGTSGTPSASNKYVTNTDARLTNARTPVTHGDGNHSALSYFDTISDGVNTRTASSSGQNIKFIKSGAASVSVGNATGYDACVTIGATNNYVSGTSFSNETITYTRAGLGNIATNLSNTWLKLSSGSEQTLSSNIKINGNLTVNGTTTTINTVNLAVSDNIIVLNNDVTGTPTENAGIEVERGTSSNVSILWDESSDHWTLTEDGSSYERIVTQTFNGMLTLRGQGNTGGLANSPDVALNIEHNDSGGSSSIFFKSTVNHPSDYAYIRYSENVGSSEEGRLTLGIENDGQSSSDHLMLKARTIINADNVSSDPLNIVEFQHASVEKAKIDSGGNMTLGGYIRGNQSGALRISSGHGYVDVGAQNTSHAHFYTDREDYYFNKKVLVDTGYLGSYNDDLRLVTDASETRLTIKNDTGNTGIAVTDPGEKLEVAGITKTQGIKVADSGRNNKFEIKYDETTASLSFNFIG